MASSERDSKAISGSGPETLEPGASPDASAPTGPGPCHNGASAQAKKGPKINLTLADPTRVKVVRQSRTPDSPVEQRPGAAPGLARPTYGTGQPQSPRGTLVWKSVPTDQLHSSSQRPRAPYDEGTIRTLAASLAIAGWQHPILVRPHPVIARGYEIVVGELPVLAARLAGLEEVSVVVCRLSDMQALECVLLEDVRRPDLMPFEVAVGYGQLIRTFNYSLPVLAKLVGKSERQVVRTLLLLDSPEAARDAREKRELQTDVGRLSNAAAGAADPDIKAPAGGAGGPEGHALIEEMAALERHLSCALGLEVAMTAKGGEGSVRIVYANFEQLEWLVRHLLSLGVHWEPEPTCPGLAA